MMVAVVTVRVMEDAVDQIVDVIAMRDGFMPAPGAMAMPRGVACCHRTDAAVGVSGTDFDMVFIIVNALAFDLMRVMQMAVVQVVDMTVMSNCDMPATLAVFVGVGIMDLALVHTFTPNRRERLLSDVGWFAYGMSYVIDHIRKHVADVFIGNGIVRIAAFALDPYELCGSQQPQMMTDQRCR